MKKPTAILQVALPVHLATVFDYYCEDSPEVGALVLVPFRNRELVGVVTNIVTDSTIDAKKIRPITAILDNSPVIDSAMLTLCQWLSRYYHAPIGEVLQLALPKVLRKNQNIVPYKQPETWHALGDPETVKDTLKNASKQWELWQFIHQSSGRTEAGVDAHTLRAYSKTWHSFAKTLLDKKLLATRESHITLSPEPAKTLNSEQQQIVDSISKQLKEFNTHLVYGVTGSGKTEVYLQLIAQVLQQEKQVLILVPEISLTPQTALRFQKRFPITIETQHSKLSDTERYHTWQRCKSGEAKIIIGTRSAVFNQFKDLGLIIIDEEHDASFKQQDMIRYNARDIAIVRAKNENIPILLGSATPALESLHNAKEGNYILHKLTQRAGDAKPAKVTIDDLRLNNNYLAISENTLQKIRAVLDKNLQVMVFINRRGFSPALYCANCGHTSKCGKCDSNMTVHKNPPHILCHHCGTSKPLSHLCPSCNAQQMVMLGEGTEKIEQQLQTLFPKNNILRIDRDTTSKKQDWQNIYNAIRNGEADILVGTQMLAKGHHFPNIALVIIAGIDQSLLSADFRATEHLAQLITQVSGRSGRGKHHGSAILQTHHPEHPVLNKIIHDGYLSLSEDLLAERKISQLPPYTRMCVLRAESKYPNEAMAFLEQAAKQIHYSNIEVLGPLPAPMEKRAGKFRYQLIVQAENKNTLQTLLKTWATQLTRIKVKPSLRWNLDIDPINLS